MKKLKFIFGIIFALIFGYFPIVGVLIGIAEINHECEHCITLFWKYVTIQEFIVIILLILVGFIVGYFIGTVLKYVVTRYIGYSGSTNKKEV